MDEYVATGRVEGGKVQIRNRRAFDAAIAALDGREVIVRIERAKANRSLNQNAWYWAGIVATLSEHTGFTPDEMHEVLKAKFLPKRLAVTDGNGEIRGEFVIGGSTTKLNKVEFGEYCEAIRRWAAEDLGCDIPDPSAFEGAA